MADVLARLQAAVADRYAVERELGHGGMATVYLAQDKKHHRKVALKVLRPELTATLGADRFFREIEVAAQLQHPNILPLLDSGEADGFYFYVMPFVEGESLRERLARHGELPVPDAIRILNEVTDALACAHAHGVVHRDIKPDNILLSGRHALVMDFGVAKAVSEATGRQTLTTAGVALGTPAYMAPEQATADPHLDHRVDLYAVGVLGYELLTGRPPFTGASAQEVLAAQVTQAPEPVEQHRPGVPPALAQVLTKCLAKRPADRWQTAEELLAQLEPLTTPSGGTTPTGVRPATAVRTRSTPAIVWGALGAASMAAVLAVLLMRRHETVAVGRATQVTFESGLEIEPAISPDGKFVAYAAGPLARMRIYVRQSGGRAVPIGPDSGPSQRRPLWSPDGTQLLFLEGGDLVVVPALGGAARVIARGAQDRVVINIRGAGVASAAWAPDGRQVAYVIGDSLYVGPVEGGEVHAITVHADMFALAWAPDGRHIALSAGNSGFAIGGLEWFANTGPSEILVVPVERGTPVPVTDHTSLNVSPAWTPDGRRLLFVSDRDGPRDVYAVRVDASGAPAGPVLRVTTGLNPHSISLSADGRRIVYSVFTARANIWSLPIPTGAPITTAGATPVTTGNQIVETMSVSRDGKRLYYDSNRSGNFDIYRLTLPAGEPERLTTDPADEWSAVESPDGRWIAFHSLHYGTRDIMVMPAAGGEVHRVTAGPGQKRYPHWSPDGNGLAYWMTGTGEHDGVYVVSRDTDGTWGTPRRVSTIVASAAWNPDGRSLLLSATQAGTMVEVPLDGRPPRFLYRPGVETRGPLTAVDAEWMPDGRRIVFRSYDREGHASFWALPAGTARPRLLVRFDDPSRPSSRAEWATDGRRLYFTIDDRQSDVYVAELSGLK